MRIVSRYILADFLAVFFATLLIFMFVMSLGVLFRIMDLLARGVAWQPVLLILLAGLPFAFVFSIPISVLTSSLLTFGRLSADGEITAMKACGIGMRGVVASPVVLAVLLTLVGLVLNDEIAPRSYYEQRNMISQLGVDSPLELLDEGRFIDEFDGMTVYIGRRKENQLTDVRIFDIRADGRPREIQARSGDVSMEQDGEIMVIQLYDVRVDPLIDGIEGAGFMGSLRREIEIPQKRERRKRAKDLTSQELRTRMRDIPAFFSELSEEAQQRQRMEYRVEMHKRWALSLASLAFVMLGVPLGMTSHRKESSIGMGISLGLVFCFYLFIVFAESLAKQPEWHPYLLVWVPVILYLALGTWLIRRCD